MNGTFPIVIKASKKLVEEFYQCEYGLYEDKCVAMERGKYDGPSVVTCEILDRHKQNIEIQSEEEETCRDGVQF